MCSYCGCEAIEVIGRFMGEHVDIVNAAGELRRSCSRGNAEDVRTSAAAVAALMSPHTGAEEVGLFTVLRRQDEFAEPVAQMCAEHVDLDALLTAVAEGDVSVVDRFVDRLREHVDREENGLFPAAAIALDGPDWEEVDAVTPASSPSGEGRSGARF